MTDPLASFEQLTCVSNFRDVAQHVPALKPGRLFRSDLVFEPDAQGARMIAMCGIRLVIDLRSPVERERLPNRWFAEAGVEVVALDLATQGDTGRMAETFASSDGGGGAHALMIEAYRHFPSGALPVLRLLGERIAAGDLPVLVHCAAGKDRTGFTMAALLAALGIGEEQRAADYLASEGRVHARTHEHTRAIMRHHLGTEVDEAALAALAGVHVDYLNAAFEQIASTYGSIDAYLDEAGLAGARLDRIREELLRER